MLDLAAVIATIQVPWPKYCGVKQEVTIVVTSPPCRNGYVIICPRPRIANQRKADFGDFGMRINLDLLGLQVFFYRKVGKPENVQAFVQNEEVLANFQQINRR